MQLLTLNQTKLNKSLKQQVWTAGLILEPAYQHGKINTCPFRGKCAATCLSNTGRLRLDNASKARMRRTKLFFKNQEQFMHNLAFEVAAHIQRCSRKNIQPAFRLNVLSDICWLDIPVGEYKNIFEMFPDVMFYDYTKNPSLLFREDIPKNYHLTYSLNEKTPAGLADNILRNTRFNVAQVFYGEMPEYYTVDGISYPTISGDYDDLRYADPRKHIVMLKYKIAFVAKGGKAYRPTKSNGFLTVVEA